MTTGGSGDKPEFPSEASEDDAVIDEEVSAGSAKAQTKSNHEMLQGLKQGAKRGLQFGKDLVWELGRRRDK